MSIAITIIQAAVMIFAPALIMRFRDTKIVKTIGSITLAYAAGILISIILFLIRLSGADVALNPDVGQIGGFVSIGIAIPLLLFSTELKKVKNISKRALVSFGILTVSVIVVSVASFFIFRGKIEKNGALAGMAIGLYTGGTPNLNAIGSILGVAVPTIALANISDMIVGGVFYLFLLTICKPLLKRFLNAPPLESYYKDSDSVKNVDLLDIKNIEKKPLALNILIALSFALVGAGLGVVVWILTGKTAAMTDYIVPVMMLVATIGGTACSFSKKVREVKGNNFVGMYLILVFSISIAMSIVWEDIDISSVYIFLEFAFITVVTFIVHVIFNKIFKIDVDCTMVIATAGIYGPAFVPALTAHLKNDNLTAPGLILGAIGYAIGTFLGAGIGYLLLLI
ncbi:MAG TPA: DUF819 family protein [Clostridia bacterium]|jgi:uncharacterized membrane protein|nr:DUF819 family protein [Clostridia bacterium]